MAISACTPQWLEVVVASYARDPVATQLITKLSLKANVVPHFTLSGGVIRYKGWVWLGHDKDLHAQVIAAMHSAALGGHSGTHVTYSRCKDRWTKRGG